MDFLFHARTDNLNMTKYVKNKTSILNLSRLEITSQVCYIDHKELK